MRMTPLNRKEKALNKKIEKVFGLKANPCTREDCDICYIADLVNLKILSEAEADYIIELENDDEMKRIRELENNDI